MKAIVSIPEQLPSTPDTYQVTVVGCDIRSHRRLAQNAFRGFAMATGLGRASLVSSYGTHEDDHGTSHFNFKVTKKIGGPAPSDKE